DLQRVGAVVLGGNVTIDTDRADAGTTAGGNILFGNATTINGNATGRTLTLDTSATDTGGAANTAGSVNLGVLGNTTELGALTVKAGTLTLNNNISVDGGGAVNLAGVATVILANNVVIDTDKANAGVTPAGDILFGTAVIKGDAAGRALILDARRQDDLGVDGIGANITLGTLAATPLLGGLTVKGNQLTLNGNISVDGGTGLNFSQVSTV